MTQRILQEGGDSCATSDLLGRTQEIVRTRLRVRNCRIRTSTSARRGRDLATGQKVHQYAIADELGLSRSTVSKVFANRNDVSEETRVRVMEAARSLGYDRGKRRNAKQATAGAIVGTTVGMLVRLGQDAPDGYQPDFLRGVSDAAMAYDATLVVHCVHHSINEAEFFKRPELQPAALRSGGLDALLLAGTWTEDGMAAANTRLPAVAIAFGAVKSHIDIVEPDTAAAMRSLVEQLTAAGHSKIAYVGLCAEESWAVERFGGCVAALAANRLSLPPSAVLQVTSCMLNDHGFKVDWFELSERLKKMIDAGELTAIVCCSDWAAYYVRYGLSQLGVSIPHDVSLTGFDDHELSTHGQPPVTSVHIPRMMLAKIAFKRLLQKCEEPARHTKRSLYRCQLVNHHTIAKPRPEC